MRDEDKKRELISELEQLREQISELKGLESERKRVEEALRENEEKYRSLVESTEDSIYLIDKNYKYKFMNKKHLSRLGFPIEHFLGRPYNEFHSAEETKEFIEIVDKVFKMGESVQHEHQSRRDNRYFLRTLSPVKDREGRTTAVTVISKDITELKQMEEQLRALSLTDELTGLYNRRGLITLAGQQLKMANRQKKGIYMLYADVDNLKGINDTLGHQEGDLALIEIANILKENYRKSDIIARIGGDEFVVIPVGATGGKIEDVTARFQKSIEVQNQKKNRSYRLSVSVGVSFYDPENHCSIDELLALAEKAMYEQKRLKRKNK